MEPLDFRLISISIETYHKVVYIDAGVLGGWEGVVVGRVRSWRGLRTSSRRKQ